MTKKALNFVSVCGIIPIVPGMTMGNSEELMIFEKKILDIYRSLAFVRCDGDGTAFYFSAEDFPGLESEPFEFSSSHGHRLKGYFYRYENAREGRLVVFDHGFGGGHRSYMREIEKLCSRGYVVFAYDHTGCMESGGENTNGMTQSLCDLNDCITSLKKLPKLANWDISVIGHSWGGFSTLNIAKFHPDISHIVVISGFVSVKNLVASFFAGPLALYRKAVMNLEHKSNGDLVDTDARDTLRTFGGRALLIYSDNDMLCKRKLSYDLLYKEFSQKPTVEFLLESGKGHNPNYTADAVKYLGEYTSRRAKLLKSGQLSCEEQKRKFVSEFDWKRMTEQDERVWARIFDILEK